MFKEDFIQGNISFDKDGSKRLIIPTGILLHHTEDYSNKSIISHFTNRKSFASAHVVIWKDGSRTVFAKDNERTWHAGISEFKGRKYCNNFMLGVEFHGDSNKIPLTEEQIQSFIEWAAPRIKQYNIPFNNITDHRTVAPDRRVDLNPEELEKVLIAIKSNYYEST